MKVILTGATGYMGNRILDKLIQNKIDVLCVRRSTAISFTPEKLLDKVSVVDCTDNFFEKKIKDFSADCIIHTAGKYDSLEYLNEADRLGQITEANFSFPLKLLGIAIDSNIPKWINTCTTLPKELNMYSRSKWQFAEWGKFYAAKNAINFYNIKLENFYGENESCSKFIPMLIHKMQEGEKILLTDGYQCRDFIYIEDVIYAYMALLNCNLHGYNDIPLGSGTAPSIREVVIFLHDKLQSNSELVFGAVSKRENEPEMTIADNALLHSIGWRCKYDWKSGLEKIIKAKNGGYNNEIID